jgi:zinc transporter ZupT
MHLIPVVHDWFLETGAPLYLKAALYGFLSSMSLPLGAVFGLLMHPIDPQKTALVVAFGAGALIFAVSTELYAEALRQVELDGSTFALKEISISMTCAVLGAVSFTVLNEKMEEWSTGHEKQSGLLSPMTRAAEKAPLLQRQLSDGQGENKGFRVPEVHTVKDSGNAAMAMWLGVALDGIPESILLGFITNERAMTVAFIVSIFLANFPEAFSSASMLKGKGMSSVKIVAMWGSLCVITTLLSGMSSAALPADMHTNQGSEYMHAISLTGAAIEGLAGGAMLAMVCATMLPEAYEQGGRWSGLCAVLGFLMSCCVKVYFGRASEGDVRAGHTVATVENAEANVGEYEAATTGGVVTADTVEKVAHVAFLHLTRGRL